MSKIFLIGAGQIGSRHLQALKKVKFPIEITVVDPSIESLNTARERYNTVEEENRHNLKYLPEIPKSKLVDLAIIASTSSVRAAIIKELVAKNKVKYLILEKLLFDRKKDYSNIKILLERKKIKTWVNCPMRLMPVYKKIKDNLSGNVQFYAHGGRPVLMGSAIHYLDYMAYLTGSPDFKLDTTYLNRKPIASRRKGFFEITGLLIAKFKNGSYAIFNFLESGEAPIVIEIGDDINYQTIIKESENKFWEASKNSQWKWEEKELSFLMQSQMTNILAENILKTGRCDLVTFRESCETHLKLLEPLRLFLNQNSSKKLDFYPFT